MNLAWKRKRGCWTASVGNRKYRMVLARGLASQYRAGLFETGRREPIADVTFSDGLGRGPAWARHYAAEAIVRKLEETPSVENGFAAGSVMLCANRVPGGQAAVPLKTAMRLAGLWDEPDAVLFLSEYGTDPAVNGRVMSVRAVKSSLDVKNTEIVRIRPRFYSDGEYQGMWLQALHLDLPDPR